MPLENVDYAASYFKYKTPTPINGELNHTSIKRLEVELTANACGVEQHKEDWGYLGLVLSDEDYAKIKPTPTKFEAPEYPKELTIPTNATQVTAFNLRKKYKEAKREYYECKNDENALLRHIKDAIEPQYLESMVNPHTQLLEADIPMVLKYLKDKYGKVPTDMVKEKETEIRNMNFNPADPLVLLFNPVEKLKKLAIEAEVPYTENQLLDLTLTVIKNTRDYETAIRDWCYKKTHSNKWDDFKKHFEDAQQDLKEVRGPTMQQAGFHHANSLVQQIRTEMADQDGNMIHMLQQVLDHHAEAEPTPSETTSEVSSATNTQHKANSAMAADAVSLEILKLLKELKQDMKKKPGKANEKGPNQKSPDDASFFRRRRMSIV